MTLEEEIARLDQRCGERMARYRDRVVLIEYVFEGKGAHSGIIRAKIIDDTTVRYVNFDEVSPF